MVESLLTGLEKPLLPESNNFKPAAKSLICSHKKKKKYLTLRTVLIYLQNIISKNYYSNRQISTSNIDSFLNRVSLPKRNDQELEILNKPTTLLEVQKVIKSSKRFKSPGPDGLSIEYYQAFEDILSPYFLSVCNLIIDNNPPPLS